MTNIYHKGEKLDLPDVADIVPNLPIIEFTAEELTSIARDVDEADGGSRSLAASR